LQPDDVLKPKTVEVLRALEIEIPKAETAEEVQAEKKEEKIAEKAPKAPTKVTEKAPEKSILSKFTRIQAVGDALANAGKEGISREDLVVKSDAIYANKGGKANPKEAKWAVKLFLDVLNSVSLIKETEGKFGL